ncbi:MAG TPA: hydrogenase maturation protease [Lacipirellulaceae bacterium]|jgi:hydrogenase maturation protease
MLQPPRILIAGIGNIFFGDDAFGCEVARRLIAKPWPDDVRVVDFGIRGLDLAYALVEGPEFTILIDAMPRGGAPGTLYVVQPDIHLEIGATPDLLDAHTMEPVKVLRLASSLGGKVDNVILVCCEPTPFDLDADIQPDLSDPVRVAVDRAVGLVEVIVANFVTADHHDISHMISSAVACISDSLQMQLKE